MEEKIRRFNEILNEVYDLNSTQALLDWDQQTYMPSGAEADRGSQLATLARLSHQAFTSDELGRLLEDLLPYTETLDADSDLARLIRVTQREYQRHRHIPSRWVTLFAEKTSQAFNAWIRARSEDNFEAFRPLLEDIVSLRREYSGFFSPYDHIYDPLLENFEPGLKTAAVLDIFNRLRPRQIALVQRIAQCPFIDDSLFREKIPGEVQMQFARTLISRLGFDWQRGRIDYSAHPFTTTLGLGDVRITTRSEADHNLASLFGAIHECGHALYEQGFSPALGRTLLSTGTSMAIHESQSRLWENVIGRSKAFWHYFFPLLQDSFGGKFASISQDDLYRGINRVSPTFIRTEADEATYNLHIMIRLDLEIAMLEGALEIRRLPEAWNAAYQQVLGIKPRNDAEGVLQDVHWSSGLMGYFPTYALGNIISIQFWQKALADHPDLEEQFASGDFSTILGWLREKIHRHGAKFESQELVTRVCGSAIDPLPYLAYLEKKYADIYQF